MVQNSQLASWAPKHQYSCSWQGVVAVTLTTERPGSVVPVPKTFIVLAVRTFVAPVTADVSGTHREPLMLRAPCTGLPLYPVAKTYKFIWSLQRRFISGEGGPTTALRKHH